MTPHDKIKAALEKINSKQWAERGRMCDYSFSVMEQIGEICDEALALLETLPPVRVKKLVWRASPNDKRDVWAITPFGKYSIYPFSKRYIISFREVEVRVEHELRTQDAAKSAAEAHYQAMIMECLEEAPQPAHSGEDGETK